MPLGFWKRVIPTFIACLVGSVVTCQIQAASLMADPMLNPWAVPLSYCAEYPGPYDIDINMGFINTDYACHISKRKGVQFETKIRQPTDSDAARWMLNSINRCQSVRKFRLQTGVSRDSRQALLDLLPSIPDADVSIGRHKDDWMPPETHAKVFQLADLKSNLYFTVHGSLNLQTVGMCCKANNALRFVEKDPGLLYGYFRDLADAVSANSAFGLFSGSGEVHSSGALPEAIVGDYLVEFYAGRAQGFVGVSENDNTLAWPDYLNPPIDGHHASGVVHWYDGVLYEAARQLQEGREVYLDILMFEIGSNSAFINHLWRFMEEGFVGGIRVDGTGSVEAPIMGQLHVRFLWQFQNHPNSENLTTQHLDSLTGFTTVGPQGQYSLEVGRIWPRFSSNHAGIVPPTTPYDMHNKVVLMSVPKHTEENRIFVASSNLDMPDVASGRLWQVGTVIRSQGAKPSGKDIKKPVSLFHAYQTYFDFLWGNRYGQASSGQVSFFEKLAPMHRAGLVNWIETVVPGSKAEVGVK